MSSSTRRHSFSAPHLALGLSEKDLGMEQGDNLNNVDENDEELEHQIQEVQKLRQEFENEQRKVAERERKHHKVAEEKEELTRRMQELRLKEVSINPEKGHMQGQSTGYTPSTRGGDGILRDKVSSHEARLQDRAAIRVTQRQEPGVLSMPGIRSLPEVRQEVEEYIARLKSIVPTLSADPTASGFNTITVQPQGPPCG